MCTWVKILHEIIGQKDMANVDDITDRVGTNKDSTSMIEAMLGMGGEGS